ncbi:MAG TPA: response regulator [Acidobacteriaceae bacterium]|jgi:DNA-binding response OmpR family regulator|nr:response regulator [Acidobacteriaceae bacterium]
MSQPAPSDKGKVVPFAIPEKKLQVLVVDDEKSIADTLALILRAKGYRAASAYDGAAGLALYRRMVPDLVISDVVMPQMNGVDMAIAIRREFLRSRILLFSGQQTVTEEMLEQSRSIGFDFEFIPKPIHPVELLDKVAELIGTPPQSERQAS